MSHLHVITVATKTGPIGFEYFLHSAQVNGITPVILGMLDKDFTRWGKGFGVKMHELRSFLDTIPDTDVVLMADAYDVIFIDSADNIMQKYMTFNKPVVLSAEAGCHQSVNCIGEGGQVTDPSSRHKYVCSGLIIGQVNALRTLLDNNQWETSTDDQLYWGGVWLNNPDTCVIDSKSELFASFALADDDFEYQKDTNQVIRKKYNTMPSLLHFNGPKASMVTYFYDIYPNANDNLGILDWKYYYYVRFHATIITLLIIFVLVIGIILYRKYRH